MTLSWINPENIADLCQDLFRSHRMEMPDELYERIWEFVMQFNRANGLKQPSERAKYEYRRLQNERELQEQNKI